jgi:hypothetical protein
MRTRNALERLMAAGRPLLAEAELLVNVAEEEWILTQIVASGRRPAVRRRRTVALVLVAAAVGGALLAGVLTRSHAGPTASTRGRNHVALTGTRLELDGYHFRTPAGFKASDAPCSADSRDPGDAFETAAAAEGGCVSVFNVLPGSGGVPAPSHPGDELVTVGSYQGLIEDRGSAGIELYISGGLVFLAQGLTEDQLIAIAASGLPDASPSGPTTTTGTETG